MADRAGSGRAALVRLVWLVVIVEAIWVVGVNGLIQTGVGEALLNRNPEKLLVRWERAWSWLPPRVHVRGLSVELHTWTLDVEARAAQASGSVRFLPLLALRGVLGAVDVHDIEVAITHEVPDTPRPSDPRPPGLRIGFEDVEIHGLERVSFNDLLVDGGAPVVRASARTQSRGPLTFDDVSFDWPDARITVGEQVVAPRISLGLHGGLGPFQPGQAGGARALLRKISGTIDINGHSKDLRPLHLLLRGAKWVERLDGSGDVAVHMALDRGKLQPGTDVDVVATRLEVWFLGFIAEGEGHVTIDVTEAEEAHLGEMDVTFQDFSFSRQGSPEPLARGAGFRLDASARDLGFTEQLDALDIVVDFPGSEVPDVARLVAALPAGLGIELTGGRAKASGRLESHGREANGVFHIDATDLEGRFRDMTFAADLAFVTRISGRDLDAFDIQLAGSEMRLFNGSFDGKEKVDDGWWMTIAIPEGRTNLAGPVEVDATLDLSMRDSRAIIAAFAEVRRGISYFDRFLTVKDIEGQAGLHARGPFLALRDLTLRGDRLEVLGELELEHERHEGIFWGKLGPFSLGVERIGKDNDFKLVHSRTWYDEQHAAHWDGRDHRGR